MMQAPSNLPLRKFTGAMPFFIAAFLNAFVDLGHKIVIQNTVYKLYDGPEQVILTAIVNALILLPFLILLSPAGFLSDKFYKSQVMRGIAWGAVVLTSAITFSYYQGWFEIAFAMTFLLAAQSAIYSPAKYGFIKELFGKERLSSANGVVSALSITAILAGSFAFTIAFEILYPKGATAESEVLAAIAPVGWLLIGFSLFELVMMYRLPKVGQPNTKAEFDKSAFFTGRLFARDLKPLKQNSAIFLSVIGLAMFWSIGQVLLAAFPSFLKETTGELNTLKVQGVLACSGIGIALGSIIAGRVSRNYIELGLLPVGALGILIGMSLLTQLESLIAFALCFLLIGASGGMFIVPLNSLIQFNAKGHALGKTLAANNWIQNLAMLFFLILTAFFASQNLSSKLLLQLMIIVALVGTIYTLRKLPQAFVRFALASVISRRYTVNVQGMRHIPASGGVLLLGNHISWIDWAILQLACPRPVRFVMIKNIYQKWYLKRFLDLMGCIPIAQGASAQDSLERVADYLNQGEVVCLFPEGTISRTGHLAEFRKGFERAAAMCNEDVVIVPFYLRGLWGSQFSRASQHYKKQQKRKLKRDLICAFGAAQPKTTEAKYLKQTIYDLSHIAWREHIKNLPDLGRSWIQRAKQVGRNACLIDENGKPISGYNALAQSLIWARRLRLHSEKTIATLLPPSTEAAILYMAAFIAGKRIATLDPQQPIEILKSQLEQLETKIVYVLDDAPSDLIKDATVIDMHKLKVSAIERGLTQFYAAATPTWKIQWLSAATVQPENCAVSIFSQSKPVHLSHHNLQANILQIADVLNATEDDVVLAQLPLHQAYGLTVSLLMPLLQGITCVPQPIDNPVADARAIGKNDVTLLFALEAHLEKLTHHAKVHRLMLESLRKIICSVLTINDDQILQLKPEIITNFEAKFKKPVFVGFGLTECSPVVSCNIPDAIDTYTWKVQIGEKSETCGMPLPGTGLRITNADAQPSEPNTLGVLWVAGPQVASAALNNQLNLIEEEETTWLNTQIPAQLDDDGYLILNLKDSP